MAPEADIAWAPINHLAFTATYRTLLNRDGYLYPTYDKQENWSTNNTLAKMNGNHADIGVGTFTIFSRRGVAEAFYSIGEGREYASGNTLVPSGHFFDTRYHRMFFQADIGARDHTGCAVAGFALVRHSYYDFQGNLPGKGNNPWEFTPLAGQSFMFLQPYVHMDAGYKFVYFYLQFGLSLQLGIKEDNSATMTTDISGTSCAYLSLGATFRLSKELLKSIKNTGREKDENRQTENTPR